ncbi:C40 family peptidase [Brevibacillus choshinensis]|uniref:C40 family peptidase n=2 Tax=Brevibacillus choshinensis TaxID=54911 RepID=A0ABX7FXY1_BRECH|nr:C40 family peptidase [Brevibacillus choshinensis]
MQNDNPTNDNKNTQNNQSKKGAAPLNLDTSIANNADQASGAIADTSIPTTTKSFATSTASSSSKTADQVISDGLKYKGVPYKFGSSKNTTRSFDCSSFTQRVFKQAGINLPRDSRQQSKVGKQVSKNQLQKGDLIFFRSYGSSSSRITHVAIYAGNNTLLHTYGKGGVTTSKFAGTSWEKRFEIARRVI